MNTRLRKTTLFQLVVFPYFFKNTINEFSFFFVCFAKKMSIFILSHDSSYSWRLSWQAFYHTTTFLTTFLTTHLTPTRVNFTNMSWTAFARADPKSAKKNVKLSSFFALLGSAWVNAARRTLVKLTPDFQIYNKVWKSWRCLLIAKFVYFFYFQLN